MDCHYFIVTTNTGCLQVRRTQIWKQETVYTFIIVRRRTRRLTGPLPILYLATTHPFLQLQIANIIW